MGELLVEVNDTNHDLLLKINNVLDQKTNFEVNEAAIKAINLELEFVKMRHQKKKKPKSSKKGYVAVDNNLLANPLTVYEYLDRLSKMPVLPDEENTFVSTLTEFGFLTETLDLVELNDSLYTAQEKLIKSLTNEDAAIRARASHELELLDKAERAYDRVWNDQDELLELAPEGEVIQASPIMKRNESAVSFADEQPRKPLFNLTTAEDQEAAAEFLADVRRRQAEALEETLQYVKPDVSAINADFTVNLDEIDEDFIYQNLNYLAPVALSDYHLSVEGALDMMRKMRAEVSAYRAMQTTQKDTPNVETLESLLGDDAETFINSCNEVEKLGYNGFGRQLQQAKFTPHVAQSIEELLAKVEINKADQDKVLNLLKYKLALEQGDLKPKQLKALKTLLAGQDLSQQSNTQLIALLNAELQKINNSKAVELTWALHKGTLGTEPEHLQQLTTVLTGVDLQGQDLVDLLKNLQWENAVRTNKLGNVQRQQLFVIMSRWNALKLQVNNAKRRNADMTDGAFTNEKRQKVKSDKNAKLEWARRVGTVIAALFAVTCGITMGGVFFMTPALQIPGFMIPFMGGMGAWIGNTFAPAKWSKAKHMTLAFVLAAAFVVGTVFSGSLLPVLGAAAIGICVFSANFILGRHTMGDVFSEMGIYGFATTKTALGQRRGYTKAEKFWLAVAMFTATGGGLLNAGITFFGTGALVNVTAIMLGAAVFQGIPLAMMFALSLRSLVVNRKQLFAATAKFFKTMVMEEVIPENPGLKSTWKWRKGRDLALGIVTASLTAVLGTLAVVGCAALTKLSVAQVGQLLSFAKKAATPLALFMCWGPGLAVEVGFSLRSLSRYLVDLVGKINGRSEPTGETSQQLKTRYWIGVLNAIGNALPQFLSTMGTALNLPATFGAWTMSIAASGLAVPEKRKSISTAMNKRLMRLWKGAEQRECVLDALTLESAAKKPEQALPNGLVAVANSNDTDSEFDHSEVISNINLQANLRKLEQVKRPVLFARKSHDRGLIPNKSTLNLVSMSADSKHGDDLSEMADVAPKKSCFDVLKRSSRRH